MPLPLEIQLQRELGDAWRSGDGDRSESRRSRLRIKAAEPNRTRRYELGVIEDIKKFPAELQSEPLVKLSVLKDCEIPIVHSRSVEEAPGCVAFYSERRTLEGTRIKK